MNKTKTNVIESVSASELIKALATLQNMNDTNN